jgi:3D (Asp-Asp-Asp) domain-containing protein
MNTCQKWLIISVLTACLAIPLSGGQKFDKCLVANAILMKQKSISDWHSRASEESNKSDAGVLKMVPAIPVRSEPVKRITAIHETAASSTLPVDEGQFVLTAYALDKTCTGKSPEMPGFGITASGKRAKVGITVAVDPKVIAYGSLIYISGIGWRVAEDTGGAIKGHHIDVLVNSYEEAVRFGVKQHRRVKIYQSDIKGGEMSATPKEVSLINIQK